MEPNTRPLEDRPQVDQERTSSRSAHCCKHQDGSNGTCKSMASMAGGSSQEKVQETMTDILDKARWICHERGKDYGHPHEDFSKIAKIWSVIFGVDILPEQIALAMMGVKIARICQSETFYHEDSVLDLAGYANCLEKVAKYSPTQDFDMYPHIADIFDE